MRNTKEILLAKGFGKSILNSKFDVEKVKNILNAKNAPTFIEAVKAIGDESLLKEAQTIYEEFEFAEYSTTLQPFERYKEFITYVRFFYPY